MRPLPLMRDAGLTASGRVMSPTFRGQGGRSGATRGRRDAREARRTGAVQRGVCYEAVSVGGRRDGGQAG